jgi:hypothetical protein
MGVTVLVNGVVTVGDGKLILNADGRRSIRRDFHRVT